MQKVLSIVLCLVLMLSFASCKKSSIITDEKEDTSNSSEKTKKSGTGKLALYFCYSDSLNPYKAESSGNQNLASLLFDPLIKLDKDLNPEKIIASSVSVSGKNVVVSLNSYQFSDGSSVTANDVVYSIKQVKGSKKGAYVNQLDNIASYKATSTYTVSLTLSHNDINVINTLDFPIIKEDSVGLTNEDGKQIPPVGSGRYVFVDDSGSFSLKGNSNYHGTVPKNKIKLNNIPDTDALEYLIKSREINIYYSGNNTTEMPELKGITKTVKLTNLVYVGVNGDNSFLTNKNIRTAISYAIDRNSIASKCYYSLATAASSLFTEKSDIRKNSDSIFETTDNTKKAVSYLTKAGYSKLNSSGYYENSDGNYIELNLLYNKSNNMQSMAAESIVKQLKACGIVVNLNAQKTAQYKSSIKNGDYDFYLAEIKLNKNFDYTSLFSKNFNIIRNSSDDSNVDNSDENTSNNVDVAKTYKDYMSGSVSVEEFANAFAEEMPFVPIAFRMCSVSYTDNLSPELISSISDPYYNIELISVKKN